MNSTESDQRSVDPATASAWPRAAVEIAGLGSWLLYPNESMLRLDAGMRRLMQLGDDTRELALDDWLARVAEPDRRGVSFELDLAARGEQEINRRLCLSAPDAQGRPVHLEMRARQVSLAPGTDCLLAVCRDCSEQVRLEQEASALSVVDPVSGLSSRRHFEQQLDREWRIAMRERSELALVLVKIDLYRRFRDNAGSQAADDIVCQLAETVRGVLSRPADLTGRMDEDCVAMLLPRTDLQGALHLARRLHESFMQRLPEYDGLARDLGLSLGASHLGESATALGADVLVSRAMAACHAAQQQGGERVESWQEDMPEAPPWH